MYCKASGDGSAGLDSTALGDGPGHKDGAETAVGAEERHVRPPPVHPHDIADCENLLESYLMQVLAAPFWVLCRWQAAVVTRPGAALNAMLKILQTYCATWQ